MIPFRGRNGADDTSCFRKEIYYLLRQGGAPLAKRYQRFVEQYGLNSMSTRTRILVDRQTGTNYRFRQSANAGGLKPLLDRSGNPILTTVFDED